MPFAQNNDVEVYYETTGDGYPIILQHGLFGSHASWYGKAKEINYAEALQDKYQVILLDARGHGKSGKPHAPEKYAMKHPVVVRTLLEEARKVNIRCGTLEEIVERIVSLRNR